MPTKSSIHCNIKRVSFVNVFQLMQLFTETLNAFRDLGKKPIYFILNLE